MIDYSSLLAERLLSMGFFNFLIFIIAFTALYAILKNKKIVSGNPIINGLLAFSFAFFVFIYPIISGINIVVPFSAFITQATIIGTVFFLGILLASVFYPNILEFLQKTFTSRNILFGMIALSLALFVTSGLITIIYTSPSIGNEKTTISAKNRGPDELSILIAGLIIVFVILLIASHISKGE
ncbi:MAG: hypothetical protein QXL14_00845 [Candidatus Aenigmatarchaeota archaeon]